jgi:hypothetical protein
VLLSFCAADSERSRSNMPRIHNNEEVVVHELCVGTSLFTKICDEEKSFEEDSVCQSLLANEYQFELKYIFRDRDRDRDRGSRTMTVTVTVDLGP